MGAVVRLIRPEFMKSSKLNGAQQLILDQMVRDGTPFPDHPSAVSAKPARATSLFNLFSNGAKKKAPFLDRPRIRTLPLMKEAGVFELETYVPKVTST